MRSVGRDLVALTVTVALVFMWEQSAATPGVPITSYNASLETLGDIFISMERDWPIPPAAPTMVTLRSGLAVDMLRTPRRAGGAIFLRKDIFDGLWCRVRLGWVYYERKAVRTRAAGDGVADSEMHPSQAPITNRYHGPLRIFESLRIYNLWIFENLQIFANYLRRYQWKCSRVEVLS
eukprot:1195006-Prorocentrum_minimum.AAC.7